MKSCHKFFSFGGLITQIRSHFIDKNESVIMQRCIFVHHYVRDRLCNMKTAPEKLGRRAGRLGGWLVDGF